MYIIKNAVRNIIRNKGKNVLLGLIALIIGLTSCLALSIRQAAVREKEKGLETLDITASISVDRMSLMQQMKPEDDEQSNNNKRDMNDVFANMETLSLEELQTYANAKSVKSFYYTQTISLNAKGIEAIETSDDKEGMGGGREMPSSMQNQADFTVIGYSTYDAMTSFINEMAAISSGEMFKEDANDSCIINEELAEYNDLNVGDTITLMNPDSEEETYKLKITGFYTTSEGQDAKSFGGMGMAMMDPANQIYTSYVATKAIADTSAKINNTDSDQALQTTVNGTYTFQDVAAYEAFEDQAKALGLDDDYSVISQDVNAYENSLKPLENLSNYAMIFLIVVLLVGGVVLVVLHIYHIRERKYEIGVLAAIGMNKKKISLQFVSEIIMVTMIAVLLGTGIGACVSVSITNQLLETTSTSNQPNSFAQHKETLNSPDNKPEGMMSMGREYLSEISSATDGMVVLEVCGVALLLVIVSSSIAVMSILRYEPLKILSNRE